MSDYNLTRPNSPAVTGDYGHQATGTGIYAQNAILENGSVHNFANRSSADHTPPPNSFPCFAFAVLHRITAIRPICLRSLFHCFWCLESFAMAQNEDVDMRDYSDDKDDEASFALARKLQDEFDRLAFASSLGLADDDFNISNISPPGWFSMPSIKGKHPVTDEEYARQLADEMNDYQSAPMSDEELARLFQMQDDPAFDFYSPLPRIPISHSPNNSVGKNQISLPSNAQQIPRPPSPPLNQRRTRNPSIQSALPYAPLTVDGGPSSLPLLSSPPGPRRSRQPKRNQHDDPRNRNDPAENKSLRHVQQLSQISDTPLYQSTTVFPSRSQIISRITMSSWLGYCRRIVKT